MTKEELKTRLAKARKLGDIVRRLEWFKDLLYMHLEKTSRATEEHTLILIDIKIVEEIINSRLDKYSEVWRKESLIEVNRLYRKYKDKIAIWKR